MTPLVRSEPVASLIPDEAAYAAAYAALPSWRRAKCDALAFAADRYRSAAAWMLARRLLAERGIRADGLAVTEDAFGRPVFDPSVGIAFSLSHSGGRVMAAVADGPIGCDVEKVGAFRPDVAAECLTADELAAVLAFPEGEARGRAFTRLWVRKESYVKALGRGLSMDLKSFSALDGATPAGWRFTDHGFADGHLGCDCRIKG